MKNIFTTIILAAVLFACNESTSTNTETEKSEKSEKSELEKKVTKRNFNITASNAYNDIFLDSMAMEKFILDTKQNDSVTRRMRSFYNARNYQYAWFASDGLTEQTRGFWNLQSYYSTLNKDNSANYKTLTGLMDRLETVENLKVGAGDKNILQAEFLLTAHFIKYILTNYEDGVVKRKELERFIPIVKRDPIKFADSLLTKKHKDNKYYEDDNLAYKALKEKLKIYYAAAINGGWQPITAGKVSLKSGMTSPIILPIKKRLQATGEMPADSTDLYNTQLQTAIINFQTSLGLTADGTINELLIKELNVPAVKRLEQILINMDRMRWMPEPEGNLLFVNIPQFELQVFEGKKKAFSMNVVVGKEGHNTMMFKGDLNQIVFSPYWNVTPDIVREEIMPAMAKNPDYCQWEGQWELIDGIPYAMSPMPIPIHQRVNGNLYARFEAALKKACKECKAYLPIDWKIFDNTIVQPDLLVVCKKIEKKYLDFTPILVVEILSPSTAVKDRNIKKEIYLSQQVKYFLIIDPQLKKVEIYELLNNSYSPVAISPNNFVFTIEDRCTADVNFEDIWD